MKLGLKISIKQKNFVNKWFWLLDKCSVSMSPSSRDLKKSSVLKQLPTENNVKKPESLHFFLSVVLKSTKSHNFCWSNMLLFKEGSWFLLMSCSGPTGSWSWLEPEWSLFCRDWKSRSSFFGPGAPCSPESLPLNWGAYSAFQSQVLTQGHCLWAVVWIWWTPHFPLALEEPLGRLAEVLAEPGGWVEGADPQTKVVPE